MANCVFVVANVLAIDISFMTKAWFIQALESECLNILNAFSHNLRQFQRLMVLLGLEAMDQVIPIQVVARLVEVHDKRRIIQIDALRHFTQLLDIDSIWKLCVSLEHKLLVIKDLVDYRIEP